MLISQEYLYRKVGSQVIILKVKGKDSADILCREKYILTELIYCVLAISIKIAKVPTDEEIWSL